MANELAAASLNGGGRKRLIAAATEAHDDLIDVKRFWRGWGGSVHRS